jgi:hypothetical protein
MSNKQSVIDAIRSLPETASWVEITDTLLGVVARNGSEVDFARLYRTQFTAEHLAEYLNPPGGAPLEAVIAELEARTPARESA